MFASKSRAIGMISVLCSIFALQACGNPSEEPEQKVEIKAAPKLSNDATTYAHEAWKFINQVDGLVYAKQLDVLEEQVRKPARKLSTDWRINVKMTDSVTEGKYALCRKALTSLEIWARETIDQSSSVAQKQADYERDKQQCKGAIDNPELGNTDPKKKGV
ncbi:hypothetical protein HLH12_02850 [Acinetobacter sp. NIPH 2377]|uniref:hypothetical protein n=1 Tax=Acinetobacter terrestris TaxID=2529843 RepID=UPI00148F6250|nr:hypothetical protein [Acinetobacter terrestris]NNH34516.1 hypothetical protein [Acinetobacter terrestris]